MKSFVVFAWLSLGLCSCSEMMDEIPNKVYIVNNLRMKHWIMFLI